MKLAEEGFSLGPGDLATLGLMTDRFAKQPNVAKTFLHDGKPWAEGQTLRQPELAATLKLISAGGTSAFYRGPISAKVAAASAANGGILDAGDLDRYIVTDDDPIRCAYRGLTVVSSAPPSSGGVVLCEILRTLEGYDLGEHPFHSAADVHLTVEAERHAYADRNTYLGDPDFVVNPVEKLLADDYAAKTRAAILPDHATASAGLEPGLGGQPQFVAEGDHTTHYSVVDSMGNAVSVTYTINLYFGAGVIAGDTGFFLNDEMDDFTSKPGSPNAFGLVQGDGQRGGAGQAPAQLDVADDPAARRPRVHGGRGARRLAHPDRGAGRDPERRRPRDEPGRRRRRSAHPPPVHAPTPSTWSRGALAPDVQAALTAEGYGLTEQKPWGLAEAIEVAPDGSMQGASDPRRPGGAAVSAQAR